MAAAAPGEPRREIDAAAANLYLEAVAGEVVEALHRAGHRCILFRGVSTARWLYAGNVRTYGDIDLLVDPALFADCERGLEALGFERSAIERASAADRPGHASTWARGAAVVDLHRRVIGVGVRPERAWQILSGRTEAWSVGGTEIAVFDPSARCLVVALHLAQHGPAFGHTLTDLERAVALVPESTWRDAARLAHSLHAETSMAAGLCSVSEGRGLFATLGLRLEGPVLVEGTTSFHSAQGLLWLARTKGMRAKARYLMLKLFPPASLMRTRHPTARTGMPGLARAYAVRLLRIVARAPQTGLVLARLRREYRDVENR